MKRATYIAALVHEASTLTSPNLPYDMQQWLVGAPGLLVKEDDILRAFADVAPARVHSVLLQMVQGDILFQLGPGVYSKNMRDIEARGLQELPQQGE